MKKLTLLFLSAFCLLHSAFPQTGTVTQTLTLTANGTVARPADFWTTNSEAILGITRNGTFDQSLNTTDSPTFASMNSDGGSFSTDGSGGVHAAGFWGDATYLTLGFTGLVKTDEHGNIRAAVAGTDYVATETDPVVLAITGLVKSDGSTISAAVAGTDYLAPNRTGYLAAGADVGMSNGEYILAYPPPPGALAPAYFNGQHYLYFDLGVGNWVIANTNISQRFYMMVGDPASPTSGTWVNFEGGTNPPTLSAFTSTTYQTPLVAGTDYVATETDPVVLAISGIVKSDGSTISAATPGTDYVATETDPVVLAITGIVKSDGSTISAAVAGTDYQAPLVAGTDYITPSDVFPSTITAGNAACADTVIGARPAVALSAYDIDWVVGEVFSITLTENTTFTFSNQIDGKTLVVAVTNTPGNWTATWPTVLWSGGTPPVLTVGAHTDVFTFINIGGTIYGSVVQNF